MLGPADPDTLTGIQAETVAAGTVIVADATSLSESQIQDLGRLAGPAAVPLFVGGRLTRRQEDKLDALGIVSLGEDLGSAVDRLDARLKGDAPS